MKFLTPIIFALTLLVGACAHQTPSSQAGRHVANSDSRNGDDCTAPTRSGERYSIDQVRCICNSEQAQNGAQQYMNACALAQADLADQALNHVYDCVLMGMRGSNAQLFSRAFGKNGVISKTQKAWIAFKTLNCSQANFAVLDMDQGSMATALFAGCEQSQSLSRLQELLYMSDALAMNCQSETRYHYDYTQGGVRHNEVVNIHAELQELDINPRYKVSK